MPNRPSLTIVAAKADLRGLHARYMNPGELDLICELVRSAEAKAFLEIGTNSGRTSLAVLRNCPTVKIAWGIDVPPTYQFARPVQRREAPQQPGEVGLTDPRYRCLLARRGTFDVSAEELPRFDAIFIDGDHSEAAIRNDYALAKKLLRDGKGIIIFHDDNGQSVVDVTRTLDALHSEGSYITHVNNSWLAYEYFKS